MKQKIIIIGGGFAGLQVARKLNGHKDFDITLIDKNNHHMFQPLFYQVACGRIEPSNISFPFRRAFKKSKNVHFRMSEVIEIIEEEKKVVTKDTYFTYDKLIIATGCDTNFFGNKKMESLTYGMKTTGEAIHIRNQILNTFERLIIQKNNSSDTDWKIVIVGSGPTGVELAGAFSELRNVVLPTDYPNMNFTRLRIILISASEEPLETMSEEAKEKAANYLKDLGVEFWNNELVVDYNGETVTLKSGKTINSSNVIWAAGVTGNIIDGIRRDSQFRNRYKVNEYNLIDGYKDIYAIGDIAYMVTDKNPDGHPQVANVAINQAKNLAKNIKRKANKPWTKFTYKDMGSMATVGTHRAVVDLPRFKFQGILAWYFWMFLHLMLILSTKNKLLTFMNWVWSYFTNDSSLRLIVKPKEKEKITE